MATPRDLTLLERERLKQQGALTLQTLKDTSLDLDKTIGTVLDFYTKQGATAERRSATAMKEVSDLEQLRAKLNADAFTKALSTVGPLVQKIASGQGSNQDYLDFLAKMKQLQLNATKAMNQRDESALTRWTQAATAVAQPRTATHTREIAAQAIRQYKDRGEYDPMLSGTVATIRSMFPNGVPPADLASDWAIVESKAQERVDQLTDLGQFASSFPDAAKNIGPEAQAQAVKTFIDSMPAGTLNEYAAKLGRLPNAGSLDQPIADKQTEAQVAKDKVDEFLKMDPMTIITQLRGGAGEVKAKENERLRVLSSEKFQKWAASNGLRVGSVRPATEADKGLPGYIASKNVVYVAGPEDDRALGIATKQATMKPSQMLIPRRGLETRKYVEATVGGTAQPGLTGFVKQATGTDGQRVFFRADGSAVKADGSSVEADVAAKLPYILDMTEEAQAKVNEKMASRVATTGGGQNIRGVETALMWSDPPDAVMAIETPEGKRVIIRKQDEKNIKVLSGGEERKNGVVRSLLAKARERIARPGEKELRAADEAAMLKVDQAREAELEAKRQAEQAAKPDRTTPAAAKAAVEAAVAEQPAFSYKEATEPTYTTPSMPTAQSSTATSPLDLGRARQVLGLLEKSRETPSTDPRVASIIRRRQGLEFVARTQPEFYQSEMVKLADEARKTISSMSGRDTELSFGGELPDKDTEFLKDLANPPPSVTPTSAAGQGIRKDSAVNMNGGNAPQMPGLATGTPSTAPAMPAPQTDAQKRSAAALALRRKQLEEEATPMGAGITPARLTEAQRAGTTEADRKLQRAYTRSYQDWAAQQRE